MPTQVLNWNTARPEVINYIISNYMAEGKYDVVESFGVPAAIIDRLRSGYTGPNEYLSPLANLIVQGEMAPPPEILNIPGDHYKIIFRRGDPARDEDINTIYSSNAGPVGSVTESEQQEGGSRFGDTNLVRLNSSFATYSTGVTLNRICGLWNAYGGYRSEIMKFFFEPGNRPMGVRIPLQPSDIPGYESAIESALNDKGIKRKTWHTLPYGFRSFSNQPFGRFIFHELTYGGWACGFPYDRWIDAERAGIPWDDGAEYNAGNYQHYVAGKVVLPGFLRNASLSELKYFRYWRVDQHNGIPGIIAASCNNPSFPGTPYVTYDDDGNVVNNNCNAIPCIEFPGVIPTPGASYVGGVHPFDEDGNGQYTNPQKAADYFVDICGHFDAIADWLEDGCPCEWTAYGAYSGGSVPSVSSFSAAPMLLTSGGGANEYIVYKNKDEVNENDQPETGDKIVKYTTTLPDGKYFIEKLYFNDKGATKLKQLNYYITESLTDESQGFKSVFNLKLRDDLLCLNDIKLPYTEPYAYHYSAPMGDELTDGAKNYNLFNSDEFTFNLIGNDKIELWLTDKRETDFPNLKENEFFWNSTIKVDPDDIGRTYTDTDPYLLSRKVFANGINGTYMSYEITYKDHDGAQTHFVKTNSIAEIVESQDDDKYIEYYPITVANGVQPYEYQLKPVEDYAMLSNGALEFDDVDGKIYGFPALAMTKKKYEIEVHDQLDDEVMRNKFTIEITPRLPEDKPMTAADVNAAIAAAIARHIVLKHSG